MAGHSEWQNRKYRKREQDRKKAKIFGKLSRKIISAARRGGGDPDKNMDLKNLIERARDADMPKENIERAIKKGTGDLPGVDYEDYIYEGYGPGGIAIMVDVTTDNKNRTISELRNIFESHGGNIGERGCVSYQFERKGYITTPVDEMDEVELFDLVVEAGAEDVRKESGNFQVITDVESFIDVKKTMEEHDDIEVDVAQITQLPKTTVPVSGDEGQEALELLEELDEHKDVQDVYSNFEMSEDDLELMDAEVG